MITLNNTTVSDNTANQGGGVYNDGNIYLTKHDSRWKYGEMGKTAPTPGETRICGYNVLGTAPVVTSPRPVI